MSSYQLFREKQDDSMMGKGKRDDDITNDDQQQPRDVEVANNIALEENEETTTSTLGDFSIVTGSPIATTGSRKISTAKNSSSSVSASASSAGNSMSSSRKCSSRKKNIKIVRVQKAGGQQQQQPSLPRSVEEAVKDEEFGGGGGGGICNSKKMENSDNHTIAPTTTTDSSVLDNDEHSNNKRRRCLLIGGAVLVVFLVSTAAATATAIGVAYGMSKSNSSRATATLASTAPVIAPSTTSGQDVSSAPLDDSSSETRGGDPATTNSIEATTSSLTAPDTTADSSYTMPTSACATIRCGTSWLDADRKCGQQCLTELCPDGEACFADMQTPLDCCANSSESWVPPANRGVEPSLCESQRCGTSWQDANDKCGVACQADPQDACGPFNETCYQDLTTNSACLSSSRCGKSWGDAVTRCGTACTSPTCPQGESCFADLSTSTLSCCYPKPEPRECTTTRCGLTWANANNYCGQSCETDADCTEKNNERCYADVTTNLDCCTNKYDDQGNNSSNSTATEQPLPATIESVPQVSCTTTRCGLTWATADSNCGPNCVDNGDCLEDGHTCFADLTIDLSCCRDSDSNNNGSDPVDDIYVSSCTTVRCGLTWVTANSNCFSNCVDNGDCTEEGYTCYADLSIDLDCCSS